MLRRADGGNSSNGSGGQTLTATTNIMGYYRFADVGAGETYVINISTKRYSFAPQIIQVNEELADLNFNALQ